MAGLSVAAGTLSAVTVAPAPYTLVWPDDPSAPPTLDNDQRAVVELAAAPGHGPLLVLAGPGTGKTTTLVEAVAARVEAGTPAERVLVLTFSRKAAQELRARLAARLARATVEPLAWTFHAFCMRVLDEAAAHDPDAQGPPTPLLAGPQQDVALRELVLGAVEDGRSPWPAELAAALSTRGFARRAAPAAGPGERARDHPERLAAASDRADWRAAASFFEEYLDVIEARGVVDYAELVGRAVAYAQSADGAALRARYDLVVVDEYQDTDPMQEALLHALAGSGRDLVVVGDPDQAIYGFRGADVRNILEFSRRFPRGDGSPATVRALTVSRRSGPALVAAARAVVAPLPVVAGVEAGVARRHRALTSARTGAAEADGPGVVEVRTYAHEAAEAAAIADVLRREHLEHGRRWESMAVLVRSTAVSGLRLRRALVSAGVPVEVAADELPLARHPATVPLLRALEVAVDLARDVPHGVLDAERAHALLVSPLGGFDTASLRRLARALRAEDPLTSTPSPQLLRDSLLDPRVLAGVRESWAAPAARLAAALAAAAALVRADAPAYDVLWSLWTSTSWPRRLEASARRGGPEGRKADHDLDAVLALFDVAARTDEQSPGRGVANLAEVLVDQQVPGDTLAERGARSGGVRLLTAHRAKGLEWDVVVVAAVQDELWPDLRRRGSLLGAERLGAEGLEPPAPPAAALAEERRLFYVAVTRARSRLLVTAVESALEDGLRPSRFLDDLGVPVSRVERAPARPLTLRDLVAELRRVAGDPTSSAALRAVAVDRLAQLADARAGERALCRPPTPTGGGDWPRPPAPSVRSPRPTSRSGCPARPCATSPPAPRSGCSATRSAPRARAPARSGSAASCTPWPTP